MAEQQSRSGPPLPAAAWVALAAAALAVLACALLGRRGAV